MDSKEFEMEMETKAERPTKGHTTRLSKVKARDARRAHRKAREDWAAVEKAVLMLEDAGIAVPSEVHQLRAAKRRAYKNASQGLASAETG